jgi:hypothetical protein
MNEPTCFGRDEPAEDINVLLDHLCAELTDHHYFRGQTGFYDLSTPSGLRHAVKGSSQDKAWIELSDDLGFDLPARMRARSDFKNGLIMVFGRAVGNMLCQQYGISSDAYDITSDPLIAGFFATRTYPTYEPFLPSSEDKIGVIYRLTIKTVTPPPLKTIENTLGSLYLLNEESGKKIWFNDVRSIRVRILKGEFQSQSDIDKFLSSQFSSGFTSGEFLKAAAYVNYEIIESAFLESAAKIEFVGAEDMIRSSRTFRQRGGLYFPPTMHSGFISNQLEFMPFDERSYTAKPGRIETRGAQRVFNINANPFVEKYFFRHDAAKAIEVDSLSLLWPSEEEDFLLLHLKEVCGHTLSHYFKDFDTTPLDFELGLIDPGYRIDD